LARFSLSSTENTQDRDALQLGAQVAELGLLSATTACWARSRLLRGSSSGLARADFRLH